MNIVIIIIIIIIINRFRLLRGKQSGQVVASRVPTRRADLSQGKVKDPTWNICFEWIVADFTHPHVGVAVVVFSVARMHCVDWMIVSLASIEIRLTIMTLLPV